MSEQNPYQAPNTNPNSTPSTTHYNQSGVFSLSGRITRLRYLAYPFIISLLTMAVVFFASFIIGIIAAVSGGGETSSAIAGGLGLLILIPTYGFAIFYAFVHAIRRLNDINLSGWLSILILVPVINLILILFLLFKPGTPDANQYGAPPSPNPDWVKIVSIIYAILLPFAMLGILAAIALPAYHDYTKRAQQAPSEWQEQAERFAPE